MDPDAAPDQVGPKAPAERPQRPADAALRVADLEDGLQRSRATLARLQADFENYRKRAQRDSEEAALEARVGLVRVLVDALDDVERARRASGAGVAVAEGLGLLAARLTSELSRVGVVRLEPLAGDAFEPDRQEAVLAVPTGAQPPGTVLRTLAPGYVLGDRLVRPALVEVAREPDAPPASP